MTVPSEAERKTDRVLEVIERVAEQFQAGLDELRLLVMQEREEAQRDERN